MSLSKCLAGIALTNVASKAASAALVTYSWTAIVTNTTGDPPQGAAVPVSITLDRDYPADSNAQDPKREATYSGGLGSPSGKSPILAATINGADALGWFDTVHIEKNLHGQSQISIQSALPQCCRSFSVVFSTTMKGVVKSVAIPKTLPASDFQSSSFAFTYTQTDVYGGTLK